MSNPIEDFLMEKQAVPEGTKNLGREAVKAIGSVGLGAFLGGAGAGGGAAAIAGLGVGAKKLYQAATAKRDFRKMLSWNADLKGEDQKLLTQSFRTLRRFSPEMSSDPLVSGSMVRQMVQAPGGAPGIIQQALMGEKSIARPVQDTFLGAVGGGASAASKEGIKDILATIPGGRASNALLDLKNTHQKEVKSLGDSHQDQLIRAKLQQYRAGHRAGEDAGASAAVGSGGGPWQQQGLLLPEMMGPQGPPMGPRRRESHDQPPPGNVKDFHMGPRVRPPRRRR